MSNKKYGLTLNLMATKIMPLLLPVTINPSLNIDQFTLLIEVLQEMLTRIERSLNQRSLIHPCVHIFIFIAVYHFTNIFMRRTEIVVAS